MKARRENSVAKFERPSATIGAARLLFAADIAGTMVFAVEGAMAAVNGNLDLIGILVLAFCTALGGGIIRDILLGALPPAALLDWRYPAIAFTGALLTFFLHHYVRAIPIAAIQVLDAAGLAIFAVAGTLKAMLHKKIARQGYRVRSGWREFDRRICWGSGWAEIIGTWKNPVHNAGRRCRATPDTGVGAPICLICCLSRM